MLPFMIFHFFKVIVYVTDCLNDCYFRLGLVATIKVCLGIQENLSNIISASLGDICVFLLATCTHGLHHYSCYCDHACYTINNKLKMDDMPY